MLKSRSQFWFWLLQTSVFKFLPSSALPGPSNYFGKQLNTLVWTQAVITGLEENKYFTEQKFFKNSSEVCMLFISIALSQGGPESQI